MNILIRCTALFVCIAVVKSTIKINPVNVAAANGGSVTFSCQTDRAPVTWYFTPNPITTNSKIVWFVDKTAQPGTFPWHSVVTTYGGKATSTITINPVNWELDAGQYQCVDSDGPPDNYAADLVTLNSAVYCASSMPATGQMQSGVISNTCTVYWHGQAAPDIAWTYTSGGGPIAAPDVVIPQDVLYQNQKQLRVDTIASVANNNNANGKGAYTCKLSFSKVPTIGGRHANNVPSYTSTCSSPTVQSLYCPFNANVSSVQKKYVAPATIMCSASCNPPCTFSWTNTANGTVTAGNTLTITKDMGGDSTYFYQCSACTTINGNQCCDTNDNQFQVAYTLPNYLAPVVNNMNGVNAAIAILSVAGAVGLALFLYCILRQYCADRIAKFGACCTKLCMPQPYQPPKPKPIKPVQIPTTTTVRTIQQPVQPQTQVIRLVDRQPQYTTVVREAPKITQNISPNSKLIGKIYVDE